MTDDEQRAIWGLAEVLTAVAQPEVLAVMRALAAGRVTSREIALAAEVRRSEAKELLWDLVCSRLATGARGGDDWHLTELGARVWNALAGILASRPAGLDAICVPR